jgi:hypothetical protein
MELTGSILLIKQFKKDQCINYITSQIHLVSKVFSLDLQVADIESNIFLEMKHAKNKNYLLKIFHKGIKN